MKLWIYYLAIALLLPLNAITADADTNSDKAKNKAKKEKKIVRTKPQRKESEYHIMSYSESHPEGYVFGVRTNFLKWAALTPSLGAEWRLNKHWSILADGTYANWTWNNQEKNFGTWGISPQVRYYMGKRLNWHIGIEAKIGDFNFKLSDIGKQGNFLGGGITGGYRAFLNKSIALDFTIGVGAIHTNCEKYTMFEGVNISKGQDQLIWLGPTSLGITLTWMIKESPKKPRKIKDKK